MLLLFIVKEEKVMKRIIIFLVLLFLSVELYDKLMKHRVLNTYRLKQRKSVICKIVCCRVA